MDCFTEGCSGVLEAACRVYLDVEDATQDDQGVVHLKSLSFSHLNDHLDGNPVDLEAGFELTCTEGCSFVETFAPELRERIGLQPIGNAERTLGKRGGLDG